MTRDEIGTLIRLCVTESGMTPREINNGNCDTFAETLCARFPGFTWECSTDADPFSHDWVSYEGVHYDAETPEGVETRAAIGTKPEFRAR